jgi:hypothetical protein
MGDDEALIGHGADVLGADVGAVLRGGEQRVQHLERRLEHLDEFQHALRRAVEAAGVGVGVGVVLAEVLELADVDLADERGDVLVVLVTGLGLGHADLAQLGGMQLDDRKLGDVAAELVEALDGPRRHVAHQQPLGNAVAIFEHAPHGDGIEETERAFEDRADAVVGGQHIDRAFLHEVLEPIGERGLAATHGTQQVEDLLLLLEALGRVPEEADDALDGLLEAVEVLEGGIDLERAVHENAPEARILGAVHELRLADGRDHALGGAGVQRSIAAAAIQILAQRHPVLLVALICLGIEVEDVVLRRHSSSPLRTACQIEIRPDKLGEHRFVARLFACNPVIVWPIRHADVAFHENGDSAGGKQTDCAHPRHGPGTRAGPSLRPIGWAYRCANVHQSPVLGIDGIPDDPRARLPQNSRFADFVRSRWTPAPAMSRG